VQCNISVDSFNWCLLQTENSYTIINFVRNYWKLYITFMVWTEYETGRLVPCGTFCGL